MSDSLRPLPGLSAPWAWLVRRPARLAWIVLALAWVGGAPAAARSSYPVQDPAQAEPDVLGPGSVPLVRLEGPLDLGLLALVKRGLDAARASTDQRMILEIDTPGGRTDLMWQFSKALEEAYQQGVTVTAWVDRQALSAGVLVALSCDRIVMTEDAVIGAAQPVMMTPLGVAPVPEEGGLLEKISSAMRAEFRAMAEKRRRPGALAEGMVDRNLEVRRVSIDGQTQFMTAQEYENLQRKGQRPEFEIISSTGDLLTLTSRQAIRYGFADGRADSLEEVARGIGVSASQVVRLETRRSEQVLGRLNEYAFVLLAAGLLLAYIELKMPGFGLPGLLSAACFILLLVGRHLVGLADVPHLVAAGLGLVLLAVELFILPGTLWFGLAGAALLTFGLVFSALGPGFSLASPLDRELLTDTTFNFLLTAVASLVTMWALSRFLPETPILRRMALGTGGVIPGQDVPESFGEAVPEGSQTRIGALGEALTDLRPVGKLRLDENPAVELEAMAAGAALERGQRVRVVEIRAGRAVVEALESATDSGSPQGTA